MSFEDVDKYFGTDDLAQGYDILKKRYDGGEKSTELLWRIAKFCRDLANRTTDNKKQHELIAQGQKYALEGYNLDQDNFLAVKWVAILTGRLTDYLGTKEKIEQGYKFKEYLDKALALDSKEHSLYHMRGRYAFGVAGLSWLERKAASVLYATPPTATYDEALSDFLHAHDVQADWLENLYYIAKCYIQKSDKANAKKYLELATKVTPSDDAEKAISQDVQKLLPKY